MWDCHHRKETDEGLSVAELIEQGLYWNRPASELIFLTRSEHMRLHHKGKPAWNRGKQTPAETIAKLSVAAKGKINPNYGKFGKDNPKYGKGKHIYQIHKSTGIIIREWKCIAEAERVLGIYQSSIVACCKGRLKSAGGFIWRYVDVH